VFFYFTSALRVVYKLQFVLSLIFVCMNPIFLVGYMGSGKSTIGRLLAANLHFQFIDLDTWIENRFHKTIRELFADYGEIKFREMEHKSLKELADFQDVVVATGGGAACYHQNMDWMNSHGITIYLASSVETLVSRLATSKSMRPLVSDKSDTDLYHFISESLHQREPYYTQAHLVVNSTSDPAEMLTARIVETINQLL
jgi:shikimate kinase